MTEIEFLAWVRGPAFEIAIVIFVGGIIIRLVEILMLGRKKSLAEPKGSEMASGLRTVGTRMLPPDMETFRRSTFTIVAGYVFHLGLFVTIFLFAPHVLLFKDLVGFGWPALPTQIVDAFAVVSIIALLAVLLNRLTNPVRRFLSGPQDYLVWFVTIAPLVTGYLAFHRIGGPPIFLLALHILSVELLMVVFPFTRLMHAFTLFMARWYTGAVSGFRGVES